MDNTVEKQKDVREIIVEVASKVFTRFGFKKTTMDEIAHAVHKGKSSIYHYFDSKVEIFKAVVEKESQLLKEELTIAIDKENTPQEELRSYVITRMQILNRLANFYSALKDEYFEHYSFIEKLREKHFRDEINMIKKILERGVSKGIFVIKDLELTAFAIITSLRGFEYLWATEQNVVKTEKSIDRLLDILFDGIVGK
jgi:AcrR family transcriptional regulator